MIKISLAVINLALEDLFDSRIDKHTKESRQDSAIEFFFDAESEYKFWLKCLGIKEWIHPLFLLTKFQIKAKKIREALE